ncbi:CLUMA_CG003586, isoform A [Clunio marinus]|uniref:CLUMA_CG003586, isoform A n=1 Tax=Clunio marinus TaxID=568069 RepID=A0A1J1HUF4_9DIPT|nr:CLUMA_CG003586, isoform A [Clunio marinus]
MAFILKVDMTAWIWVDIGVDDRHCRDVNVNLISMIYHHERNKKLTSLLENFTQKEIQNLDKNTSRSLKT